MIGPAELALVEVCVHTWPPFSATFSGQSITAAARIFLSVSSHGQAGTPELFMCHMPKRRDKFYLCSPGC